MCYLVLIFVIAIMFFVITILLKGCDNCFRCNSIVRQINKRNNCNKFLVQVFRFKLLSFEVLLRITVAKSLHDV